MPFLSLEAELPNTSK